MTDKPAILVVPRHLAPLASLLDGAYEVYRFWEGPPADAAHNIRAVITVGEVPLERALLESLPKLGLVAYFSVGHESFDPAWAKGRGVAATHARGVNHDDTADLALGLIIASVRGIAAGDRQVRAGEWIAGAKAIGPSLGGKRVGIVGLGAIGSAVAARCEALRTTVSWWARMRSPAPSGRVPPACSTWPRPATSWWWPARRMRPIAA